MVILLRHGLLTAYMIDTDWEGLGGWWWWWWGLSHRLDLQPSAGMDFSEKNCWSRLPPSLIFVLTSRGSRVLAHVSTFSQLSYNRPPNSFKTRSTFHIQNLPQKMWRLIHDFHVWNQDFLRIFIHDQFTVLRALNYRDKFHKKSKKCSCLDYGINFKLFALQNVIARGGYTQTM